MIISEKNNLETERKEKEIIKNLMLDVNLPRYYYFDKTYVEINFSRFFGFLSAKIANLKLSGDTVRVRFEDEEEYNRLKPCFEKSKNKFELELGDTFY
jgi:hypothetical protein